MTLMQRRINVGAPTLIRRCPGDVCPLCLFIPKCAQLRFWSDCTNALDVHVRLLTLRLIFNKYGVSIYLLKVLDSSVQLGDRYTSSFTYVAAKHTFKPRSLNIREVFTVDLESALVYMQV